MATGERAVLIWLCLYFLLYGSVQGANTDVQQSCLADIKCPTRTSEEGDEIEYVLKVAPKELQTLFSFLDKRTVYHHVCREPACLCYPCLNGGSCKETFEGFACSCPDGYSGNSCDFSMILSVSLHGSDHGTSEGSVGFTSYDSPSQVKLFTNEAWSMKTSHLVCQHLGYSRGAYATLSGNVYNTSESNASPEYGAIRCDQDARNISECWYESRPRDGVSSDMIIAVVCCTSLVCRPEGEPLGISSGVIPDSAITKSSCNASLDCDSTAGRLHSNATWIPAAYDYASPWIEISLESVHMISGVATQSHHSLDDSTTSYTVSFRLDTDTWFPYKDVYTNSNITVFQGHFTRTIPVEHSFHPPLMARFIRLHPRTYVGSPSLRFELIGYGPLADYIGEIYEPNLRCAPPLGKKLGVANSSIIPDSSFFSSSLLNNDFRPYNARLFGNGVWAPASKVSSWWTVDLGTVYQVTGVMTQGRQFLPNFSSLHQWTTSYELFLSLDGRHWMAVSLVQCGFLKEFSANFDRETPVTNLLPTPISAQFVRVHPKTFHGYPMLRCEILGF